MGMVDYLRDGLGVLIWNRDATQRLAGDHQALGVGLLVVLLAGLAQGVKAVVTGLRWWELLLDPLILLGVFLLVLYLFHVTAFLLGGASSFVRLLRPASCAYVAGWALLVPWLGVLLQVAYLLALVPCVRRVHRLSLPRSLLAVAIPVVVALLLFLAAAGAVTLLGLARG